jgi:sec-independent protein translocase protein TatA
MPFGIGPAEIIIVLVIVLLVFGPKRLPDLGRSLGKGMREFKDSVTGKDKDEQEELPAVEAESSGEPSRKEGAEQPAGAAAERKT